MLFLRQRKTAWVGLSLHTGHISLIRMQKTKHALTIEQFKQTPLPSHVIQDGKVNYPYHITQRLRLLVMASIAENCDVALAFPAVAAIQKSVQLPLYLKGADCVAEIAANMTDYFPGVSDALNFDYAPPVSPLKKEGLLIAAKTVDVDAMIAAVEAAPLHVRAVDLDIFALVRAMNFIYGISPQMTLLLDMTSAQLLILQNGSVLFFQQIAFDTPESFSFNLRRSLQLASASVYLAALGKIYIAGTPEWQQQITKWVRETLPLPIESVQLTAFANKNPEVSAAGLMAFGLALKGVST